MEHCIDVAAVAFAEDNTGADDAQTVCWIIKGPGTQDLFGFVFAATVVVEWGDRAVFVRGAAGQAVKCNRTCENDGLDTIFARGGYYVVCAYDVCFIVFAGGVDVIAVFGGEVDDDIVIACRTDELVRRTDVADAGDGGVGWAWMAIEICHSMIGCAEIRQQNCTEKTTTASDENAHECSGVLC